MSLLTNLQAYWKLDEASGNATDATGNGYTLTQTGTLTRAAALINNGASYTTSASNYLSTSSLLGTTTGSAVSMSIWAKWASETTSDRDICTISYPTSGSTLRILYEYNGGTRRIRAYRGGSSTTFCDKTGNYGNNVWHHFVFTYDGTNLKLYVDNGTAITGTNTGNGTITVVTGFELAIFNASYAPTNGLVDEVGFWSRALTSAEVTELYNGGAGLSYDDFGGGGSVNSNFFALMR